MLKFEILFALLALFTFAESKVISVKISNEITITGVTVNSQKILN